VQPESGKILKKKIVIHGLSIALKHEAPHNARKQNRPEKASA
jgi:hypothetical protein